MRNNKILRYESFFKKKLMERPTCLMKRLHSVLWYIFPSSFIKQNVLKNNEFDTKVIDLKSWDTLSRQEYVL